MAPDKLNTHHPALLQEAFEPTEALHISEHLEVHYRSKNGSWLNPVLSLPRGWPRLESGCRLGNVWSTVFPTKVPFGGGDRSTAGSAPPGHHTDGPLLLYRGRPHQTEVPLPNQSNADGLLATIRLLAIKQAIEFVLLGTIHPARPESF